MTTSLLTLLVLIELARLVLQYRSGKTYAARQEKTYCAACEVIQFRSKVRECDLQKELETWGNRGFEIASVTYSGFSKADTSITTLCFSSKRKLKAIKTAL